MTVLIADGFDNAIIAYDNQEILDVELVYTSCDRKQQGKDIENCPRHEWRGEEKTRKWRIVRQKTACICLKRTVTLFCVEPWDPGSRHINCRPMQGGFGLIDVLVRSLIIWQNMCRSGSRPLRPFPRRLGPELSEGFYPLG